MDIDEKIASRKSAMLLDYSSIQKLITKDLKYLDRSSQMYFLKYSKEQVAEFIQNPYRWQRQLREISNNLYNVSSQYKRLVNYFVTLPTFAYLVEPFGFDPDKVDKKKFKTQYRKTLEFIDTMSIKHEFAKVLTTVFLEDVFYGYEHQSKDQYFIQKLDPFYCRISSFEDGCFNFQFNFGYFDTYKDRLELFPSEFSEKYAVYLRDKVNMQWQELESNKTICIKANEHFQYAFPPFAGLFESIIEIQDYKSLRKSKVELENYKLLIQQLPMRDKSEVNNDFMIDYDNMISFHNQAAASLPDQIGLITTPMKVTEINFERSGGADIDSVGKAVKDFWDNAGVSQLLFNTDKSSSIGLNRSINTDENTVFLLLRQFERWINRKIKKLGTQMVSWRVTMLDITYMNEKDYFDRITAAGERGFPVRSIIAAASGLTPAALMNMTFLENEILGLPDTMVPLQTSHTMDNTNDEGAPKKSGSKLTSEGLRSRDKPGKT